MDQKFTKTDEYTIKSGWLDTGEGHKVWYEQWGNKDAKIPILVFHGGPGGQFKPRHKHDYDPKVHQVIGFDQRGSGNSTPYGKTQNNTTDKLIADAKAILDKLNVAKVHVSGGSWGSTLATLFAIKYPKISQSLMINGVFLGTQKELDWIDKGLFKYHYPEVWEKFVSSVPEEYKQNPADYHYGVLEGDDSEAVKVSSKALEELEGPIMPFDWPGFAPDIKQDVDPSARVVDYDPVPYKLYAHYFKNNCFLEPDFIINNANKLSLPVYIVQGRYDMACPPISAYNLHKQITDSNLYMTLASHGNHPETRTALKALRSTVY